VGGSVKKIISGSEIEIAAFPSKSEVVLWTGSEQGAVATWLVISMLKQVWGKRSENFSAADGP
jgi:hypothetical protein